MEISNRFYKNKLRQLHKIRMLLMIMANKNRIIQSPRVHETVLKASGVTFLMFILGILFDDPGKPYFIWVLIFLFSCVAFFVYKASSRANTWIEEIDNNLMEYEPVDIGAYQTLQREIRDRGTTHIEGIAPPIFAWLSDERRAVNEILHPEIVNARIAKESERQQEIIEPKKEYEIKFIKKIVNEDKER